MNFRLCRVSIIKGFDSLEMERSRGRGLDVMCYAAALPSCSRQMDTTARASTARKDMEIMGNTTHSP